MISTDKRRLAPKATPVAKSYASLGNEVDITSPAITERGLELNSWSKAELAEAKGIVYDYYLGESLSVVGPLIKWTTRTGKVYAEEISPRGVIRIVLRKILKDDEGDKLGDLVPKSVGDGTTTE